MDEVYARQVEKVTDNINLLWRSRGSTDAPFEGNCVVIEQSDGLVVVDAGGSPVSGAKLVGQIRSLSPKPVRYLIYTHYHGDHNLGAGAFLQAWPGVEIISTEATRRNMLGPAMNYISTYSKDHEGLLEFARRQAVDRSLNEQLQQQWARLVRIGPAMVTAYKDLKPYPAGITFRERLTLHDELAPVEIAYLGRANTDGDAIIWAPKQRVLVSGDIVVAPIPYASASYPGEWIAVLQEIEKYDFEKLIPGHGPVQSDHAYLEKLRFAIDRIRQRTQSLAQNSRTIPEIRADVPVDDLLREFAGDDQWNRRQMRGFFLNAIISNAVKEARREPIEQGHDGG